MEWIFSSEVWIALITLTALEIVLGIDNIIFITILVGRLPVSQRRKGSVLGLTLAMITRILLLFALSWVMHLTTPLFQIFSKSFSGRDLILIFGGLFLLAKSTHEIHVSLEGPPEKKLNKGTAKFTRIIIEIGLLDIVFSLDSVITAVGLVDHLAVMVIAIVIAMLIMMVAVKPIGDFVETHPTIKMLALSFLILVGFVLLGEGFGLHVPKGYIYFAMAFSVGVEMLNLKMRARLRKPLKLHKNINRELEGAE